MKNSNYLYNIFSQVCNEKGYEIKGYSNNYIIEILNKNKSIFIYGNSLPLNNNSSQKIGADKSALYSVASVKNLPCVEHKIVKNPSFNFGNAYHEIETFLNNYPSGIVVKDNKGSCGRNVFLVKTKKQLKVAAKKIFSKNQDVAISPFIENSCEYRVIMLDGTLCVAYKKIKPFVVGDGKTKVKNLIKKNYGNFNFELEKKYLNYTPKENEKFVVGWKNNLAFNSTPQIVTNKTLLKQLTEFAKKVIELLNLRFCSVDIFETPNGLKLLEVNTIVSMEIFSKTSKENYELTKSIFTKALEKCFNEKEKL